jgi:uncharacterized membrane protein
MEITLSDQTDMAVGTNEDKVMPAVDYGLYLLGLTNGFTIVIGLVVAYANRASAGPQMSTHYEFLIRTFWMAIGWFLIGVALVVIGIPLTLVLIGVPMWLLGGFICGAVGIWFAIRSILGVVYLARGDAYPRPMTWLF